MSEQTALPLRPLARNSDPETSHQAAAAVPTAQRLEALAVLSEYVLTCGVEPTSHELAGVDLRLRYRFARRLSDLRELGLVENGPARACRITRKQALTWRVTPQGRAALGTVA